MPVVWNPHEILLKAARSNRRQRVHVHRVIRIEQKCVSRTAVVAKAEADDGGSIRSKRDAIAVAGCVIDIADALYISGRELGNVPFAIDFGRSICLRWNGLISNELHA